MIRRLVVGLMSLSLAACATASTTPPLPVPAADGWAEAPFETRPVTLGLPGGAVLADGVRFAGGVRLALPAQSPFHSLSDLKLTDADGGFVSVTDEGDLVSGRIVLDGQGRLSDVADLRLRRLTDRNGAPIAEKVDGDAEGLALLPDGRLLVSFERDHRIWSYGRWPRIEARPSPVSFPDYPFPRNDGMEALSAAPNGGWRVGGEDGGIWDCSDRGCRIAEAPPTPLLGDDDFRRTGLDRDPAGDGWFLLERSFRPPVDARARVRRMAADGTVGPVLIELKLPGLTDNFEGVAAETRGGKTRLYLLSDDNNNPAQKTLLLAFDID